MVTCYRLTQRKFASSAFDGEGPKLYGGRWNNKGTTIIYTAGSLSLAVLELFVHLDSHEVLSERYCYFSVQVPDKCLKILDIATLVDGWDKYPAISQTKTIGDEWVAAGDSTAMKVPSAIVAGESNYLINPKHPEFSSIVISDSEDFRFDSRLLKTA